MWTGQTGEVLAVCPCLRCSVLRDDQVLIELGHDIGQGHAADTGCQKSGSGSRPNSGKRLRRKKENCALRACSQSRQRRTVERDLPVWREPWFREPPASHKSSTTCCMAQSDQRRGVMQAGKREQVRRHALHRKRRIATRLRDCTEVALRSALRW